MSVHFGGPDWVSAASDVKFAQPILANDLHIFCPPSI